MHAVILAAGRARRLGTIGERMPKCLIRVGGRSLLEYSLDNLVQHDASGITIVTGHCDGAIQQAVGTHWSGVPIRYCFNRYYAQTGSLVSLLLGAGSVMAGSLLVLESDILYHPDFVDAAMTAADDTLLVADASGSGDEVFICRGQDNRLSYLGKEATALTRERSIGEYAGIARLSARFCSAYCEQAERLLRTGRAAGHYEELIFALSRAGHDVRVSHRPFLPWTEIDTMEDLARAKDLVYPALSHLWEAAPRAPEPASPWSGLHVAR